MSDSLVIDASVAVKWYLFEEKSDDARGLFDIQPQQRLLAPDLIVPELGNILWKRLRQRLMSAAEVDEIAGGLVEPDTFPVDIVSSASLIETALDIAVECDRTVYDCLYVALAVANDTAMVTADRRLVNAFSATSYATNVRLL